jgi:hypothetical protein
MLDTVIGPRHGCADQEADGRNFNGKRVGTMSPVNQPVASTGWAEWAKFAGIILLINGIFRGLRGLVALTGPDTYHPSAQGTLFLFDQTGWG